MMLLRKSTPENPSLDPDASQTRQAFTRFFDLLKELFSPIPLRHTGSDNLERNQESERINPGKTLTSLDFIDILLGLGWFLP